jgi:hypothetical protein
MQEQELKLREPNESLEGLFQMILNHIETYHNDYDIAVEYSYYKKNKDPLENYAGHYCWTEVDKQLDRVREQIRSAIDKAFQDADRSFDDRVVWFLGRQFMKFLKEKVYKLKREGRKIYRETVESDCRHDMDCVFMTLDLKKLNYKEFVKWFCNCEKQDQICIRNLYCILPILKLFAYKYNHNEDKKVLQQQADIIIDLHRRFNQEAYDEDEDYDIINAFSKEYVTKNELFDIVVGELLEDSLDNALMQKPILFVVPKKETKLDAWIASNDLLEEND